MSEFPAAEVAAAEYKDIEMQMASPDVLAKPEKLRSLGRRYAELRRVVSRYERWVDASTDLTEAREIVELGGEDGELFADELPGLEKEIGRAHV